MTAQTIAGYVTELHQLAFVAGDMNELGRSGPIPLSEEIETWPLHLQLTRAIRDHHGKLTPRFTLDDEFTRAGMVDVAAALPPKCREPAELGATAVCGTRIDRGYAVEVLAKTARRYQQVKIGSDHDAGCLTFDLRDLAF